MRRNNTGIYRKQLALLLVFALLTGLLLPQKAEAQEIEETEEATEGTDYGLHNPEIGENSWDTKTWDCVYFGHYWQSDTNDDGIADKEDAKEPILWRVLSVDGDDAFLIAEHNLEEKMYCEENRFNGNLVTWETSTLRSWLNGYDGEANQLGIDYTDDNFLDEAFSPSEQAAIRETNVENRDNWFYNTWGGNNTTDRVYLLSLREAITEEYGFHTGVNSWTDTRSATDTDYLWETRRVEKRKGHINSIYKEDEWWLRSPGAEIATLNKDEYPDGIYPSNRAVILRGGSGGDPRTKRRCGYINPDGQYSDAFVCVRPVLHLDLSQRSCWTYAGTVSAQPFGENLLPAPVPEETPARTEQPAQTPDPEPPFPGTNDTPVPPVTGSDGVTTWDCVYFGRYWQNDTNKDGTADRKDAKEKIKWRVLAVDGDDVLLLADKVIAYQPYNEIWVDVTWATSTMRSWLNGYDADANVYGKNYTHNNFLNYAFSASEQAAIMDTELVNADDDTYGTEGGEDTTDKVYLLSKDDMENHAYGFWDGIDETESGKSRKSRVAKVTKYVKKRGAFSDWWLRSPAEESTSAWYVSNWGDVSNTEAYVDDVQIAVRPALHLNTAFSSCWSNAGQVTSDGEVIEPATPTPAATPTVEPSAISSVEPTVSYKPTDALPAPTLKSLACFRSENGNGIELTWDPVEDADGYVIYSYENGVERLPQSVAGGYTDSYKFYGLTEGATYHLQMAAYKNVDSGREVGDATRLRSIMFITPSETTSPSPGTTTTAKPDSTDTPKPGSTDTPKPYSTDTPKPDSTDIPDPGPTSTVTPTDTLAAPKLVEIKCVSDGVKITWESVEDADGYLVKCYNDKTPDFVQTYKLEGHDTVSYVDLYGIDGERYVYSVAAYKSTPSFEAGRYSETRSVIYQKLGISSLVSPKPTEIPNVAGIPDVTGTSEESGKPMQPGGQTPKVTEGSETKQLSSPGKVTGLKLKAKKKAIQVSWKKCLGAKGYEIWYSTSKKWKKKKVKVTKATKWKLKKLKSKKVYYIRVRAYIIRNGKKVYGKWRAASKKTK